MMNILLVYVFFVTALAVGHNVNGWPLWGNNIPRLANSKHLEALVEAEGVIKHENQLSWLVNKIQTHHTRDLQNPEKDAEYLDKYLKHLAEQLYAEDPEIEHDYEGTQWTLVPIIREVLNLTVEKTELNETIIEKISKLLNFSPTSKQIDGGIISKLVNSALGSIQLDSSMISKILNETLGAQVIDNTNLSKLLNLSLGIKEVDCSFRSMRYTIAIIEKFFVSINDFINGYTDSGPNKRYKRTRDYLIHKIGIHLKQCSNVVMKNYDSYKRKTAASSQVSSEVIMDELLLTNSGSGVDIVELASKKDELSVKPYTSITKAIEDRKLCKPGILNRLEFVDKICVDLSSATSDSVSFYELIAVFQPRLLETMKPIEKRFHKLREYSRLCNAWIGFRGVFLIEQRALQLAKKSYNIEFRQ